MAAHPTPAGTRGPDRCPAPEALPPASVPIADPVEPPVPRGEVCVGAAERGS
jgi:hypothetical protein